MKSTLKQKQPLDINKEIQITRLHADPNMIQQHVKNLKNLFKNESDQQINQRVTQIIARDNIFNAIMNEIVHNYDITFDEQELTQLVERIKPQFQNRSDDVLREIARKIIIKSLIFQQLAKEWNVIVSDDDVKKSLDQYNLSSGEGIRQYMENLQTTEEDKKAAKAKFEGIRNVMIEEKTAAELIKRFNKVRINWEIIKKQQEEAIAKQKELQAKQQNNQGEKKA